MKTFKSIREAVASKVVKSSKGQSTTKDDESKAPKPRVAGEREFADSHGLETHSIKYPEGQFTSDKKQASHDGPGEKTPIRTSMSSVRKQQIALALEANEEVAIVEELDAELEQVEMNEDIMSSLKSLAASHKSGNLKFQNGETGLVNSQSANKIVSIYNKLSPENAKQMKANLNKDVVSFMKVLHFVDKTAKVDA